MSTTEARRLSGKRRPPERGRAGSQAAAGEELLLAVDQAARDAVTAALAGPPALAEIRGALVEGPIARGADPHRVLPHVLDRALGDIRLGELPPASTLQVQALLVAAAVGSEDVSIWVTSEPASKLACAARTVGERPARRAETAARLAIETGVASTLGSRSPFLAVPVAEFGLAHAALVVRLATAGQRDDGQRLAASAGPRLAVALERSRLLERSEQRERALVEAAERRLVRTGYDLHDGPLQDVVGLAEELRLLAADFVPLVQKPSRTSVRQGLDSVREQVSRLGDDLRDIAQSLETSAASRQPLDQLLARAASSITRRTNIVSRFDVRGDLSGLTDSQRITLYRVVQEALANVAEHSGASNVAIRVSGSSSAVTVTIADDGHGFDPSLRLEAAVGVGRLGLVGMAERVRLLGGLFRLTSAPGRGTTVRVVLSRWAPPADDRVDGYFS